MLDIEVDSSGKAELDLINSFAVPLKDPDYKDMKVQMASFQGILSIVDKSKSPDTIQKAKEALSFAVNKGLSGYLTQLGRDTLTALGEWGKQQVDLGKKTMAVEVVDLALTSDSSVSTWEKTKVNTKEGQTIGEKREKISMHDLAIESMIKIGGSVTPYNDEELKLVNGVKQRLGNFAEKFKERTPLPNSIIRAINGVALLGALQGVKDVNTLNIKPNQPVK